MYENYRYSRIRTKPYSHGRGNCWKCTGWHKNRNRCNASVSIVDGKVSNPNPPNHEHDPITKRCVEEKMTTDLFALVKEKRAENPFCQIDLQQEYEKLKSSQDNEFIPDCKAMKSLLKKYFQKKYPKTYEEENQTQSKPLSQPESVCSLPMHVT